MKRLAFFFSCLCLVLLACTRKTGRSFVGQALRVLSKVACGVEVGRGEVLILAGNCRFQDWAIRVQLFGAIRFSLLLQSPAGRRTRRAMDSTATLLPLKTILNMSGRSTHSTNRPARFFGNELLMKVYRKSNDIQSRHILIRHRSLMASIWLPCLVRTVFMPMT